MSEQETGWKIILEAECETRERAIEIFGQQLAELRKGNFKECSVVGSGSYFDGTQYHSDEFVSYSRSVCAPRQNPLQDWELRELRALLARPKVMS